MIGHIKAVSQLASSMIERYSYIRKQEELMEEESDLYQRDSDPVSKADVRRRIQTKHSEIDDSYDCVLADVKAMKKLADLIESDVNSKRKRHAEENV